MKRVTHEEIDLIARVLTDPVQIHTHPNRRDSSSAYEGIVFCFEPHTAVLENLKSV